jgi:hypothetical protein
MEPSRSWSAGSMSPSGQGLSSDAVVLSVVSALVMICLMVRVRPGGVWRHLVRPLRSCEAGHFLPPVIHVVNI